MLKDRYDLPVPTGSAAARDALVAALDLALAGWPGAVAGFEAALAHDPGLTLAQLGKARALQAGGSLPRRSRPLPRRGRTATRAPRASAASSTRCCMAARGRPSPACSATSPNGRAMR
jgi:hypothetical protein